MRVGLVVLLCCCCSVDSVPAASLASDPDAVASLASPDAPVAYAAVKTELVSHRARLQTGQSGVEDEAAALVFDAVRDDLLPAWMGTVWDFNGTTEIPGEGTIACGYLVSTVLRDAGFAVERRRLAQQPAERIIQTLTPESEIRRFSDPHPKEVLAHVAARGDGLYLVGLDYHVGFLVRHEGQTRFCHSSYLPPGRAVCSDPLRDAAFASRYYVVGRLLGDAMMRAWLDEATIPTRVR